MPMYLYGCPVCNAKREVFKPLAEIDRAETCAKCSFAMNRLITAAAVYGDYPAYKCPVTGNIIEGRKAHIENLARTGCRVYEPGETEAIRRRAKEADEALLEKMADTVEETIHKMPVEKRDKLAGELEGGMGLSVNRSTPSIK